MQEEDLLLARWYAYANASVFSVGCRVCQAWVLPREADGKSMRFDLQNIYSTVPDYLTNIWFCKCVLRGALFIRRSYIKLIHEGVLTSMLYA